MTDAGWAEKKVDGYGMLSEETAATLLRQEHARAIRLVKAEIKRVNMDQHSYSSAVKTVLLLELGKLLAKLERGRGGKG